jgi:hypothetical protein
MTVYRQSGSFVGWLEMNLPFFFGKRERERVQLKGIPCDEVSCPRTATLVFGANRFHCVLISKSTN